MGIKLEDAIEIARELIENQYTMNEYTAIKALIEHAEKTMPVVSGLIV